LVIEGPVIVPELLTVDVVAHAEEQCLRLEIGLVCEFDAKVEVVEVVMRTFPADIVVVVRHDLGSGLPVIEGEADYNRLMESKILDRDIAHKVLVVG
jgi:hypothetical protein